MVEDFAVSCVVVRPQRRNHCEAFLTGLHHFGRVEHRLEARLWLSTVERRVHRDVAV